MNALRYALFVVWCEIRAGCWADEEARRPACTGARNQMVLACSAHMTIPTKVERSSNRYHAGAAALAIRLQRAAGRAGTRVGERIVDRTSGDQLERLTASVPHAGRACTREPSERRVAGQRGSTLQAAEGLLLRVMRSPVMRSRGLAASRGAHPASGRAPSTQGMRARVRWTAAWQLPSRRASRSHRLTRKQHPWASRASSAARVESRACPRPYQHWIRSPARSR